MNLKGKALSLAYGKWTRPSSFEEGYTVLLPSPMDMPFLLRFALEGLARLDTTHCREIVVAPDATLPDDRALRTVVADMGDPRVKLVRPRALDRFVAGRVFRGNGSALHWLAIVLGTTHARCGHIFLHDADAFFSDAGGLERQYQECAGRGMDTLGVTARWDPALRQIGYALPGTWEMMYSHRWVRKHAPADLKGRWVNTPHGPMLFDTMLYPQYLDYPGGRVGSMAQPPAFVHFHGTIVTYRVFKERARGPVVDELFRLLLLAILQELIPGGDGPGELPCVDELAAGLTDSKARVRYDTPGAAREYPNFRAQLEALCLAPIFEGPRAERVRQLVAPFDEHFADPALAQAASGPLRFREHGLG